MLFCLCDVVSLILLYFELFISNGWMHLDVVYSEMHRFAREHDTSQ